MDSQNLLEKKVFNHLEDKIMEQKKSGQEVLNKITESTKNDYENLIKHLGNSI